ncbi:hypothetical protein ACHAXA_007839 [Cyclostephanos tholiformis]|uniref:Uncharacterized protein n=1 Tax=Cyclostephanos tholiformis TaxID=382380 RepID=A0ABD3SC72_9STRA
MPNSPRIYLIHVGKAGGTTLTRALMLDNTTAKLDPNYKDEYGRVILPHNVAARSVQCMVKKARVATEMAVADVNITFKIHDNWIEGTSACYKHSPDASQLTRRTLGVYHMQGAPYSNEDKAWLLHNTNMFLFTVRDPIERLASAYNYHRHQFDSHYRLVGGFPQVAKFYEQCFPEGFDMMIDNLRNKNSAECFLMGVQSLLGKIGDGLDHFEFNYEHYLKYSLGQRPNHPVAVLRTEHLWEDVIHLDQDLGGTGDFSNMEGFKFSHGSEKYTEELGTKIGTSNEVFLCCLIYREIEFYQLLILKALNLADKQKHESLNDLLNRCHIKTHEKDVLKHPFSWRAFRQGEMCSGLMGNSSDPHSAQSVSLMPRRGESTCHWCCGLAGSRSNLKVVV